MKILMVIVIAATTSACIGAVIAAAVFNELSLWWPIAMVAFPVCALVGALALTRLARWIGSHGYGYSAACGAAIGAATATLIVLGTAAIMPHADITSEFLWLLGLWSGLGALFGSIFSLAAKACFQLLRPRPEPKLVRE